MPEAALPRSPLPEPPRSAAAPPVVQVDSVTRIFGTTRALAEVSLSVQSGEIRCLLGENGAGKTTLCNLLFGVYAPDEGRMLLRGREFSPASPRDAITSGIAMVHQHFSLIPTLSVLDNLMLGRVSGVLDRGAARRRVSDVTARLGVTLALDARVEDLSVSARQLAEIVKCLLSAPTLLLLDEPTAVLPVAEIQPFLSTVKRIADSGCAVILVTHKLAEIANAADSVTVLRHGRTVAESMRPAEQIDHLVAAMIGREGSTLLRRSDAAPAAGESPSATPVSSPHNRDALTFDGVHANDAMGSPRLANFTLIVRAGEIVGVAGVEGNGQTELAEVVSGLTHPVAGRIFLGDLEITRARPRDINSGGAAIIPEDRHAVGCILDMNVAENLGLSRLADYTSLFGMLDRQRLHDDAARLIATYDIRCKGPSAPMHSLSGGNQQKVVLARELSRSNLKFVLAAHPTRGLDVGAVESVYAHLREAARRGAGILLITSELDELFAVADRIVVLYRGRIAGELGPATYTLDNVGALMSGQQLQ